ncbi:hypothetical protein [Actinomycetospora atypica]|uniref:Uncharacterized protein n=1 Tax=Actinomycetospora atypica TaxID=1290095 RepID=A0ABV9YI98_9PSEU
MNPQERYDRFRSALGFRADLAETADEAAPGLSLAGLDGEPIEPAVRLHVDPTTLADHVGGPAEVDDVDDLEAGRLQTLLAQIEEAILVREPGQDHLVLVDGVVRAVSEEPARG